MLFSQTAEVADLSHHLRTFQVPEREHAQLEGNSNVMVAQEFPGFSPRQFGPRLRRDRLASLNTIGICNYIGHSLLKIIGDTGMHARQCRRRLTRGICLCDSLSAFAKDPKVWVDFTIRYFITE